MTELEDLYRPYKPKKKTRASIAKEKGLEPLAEFILKQDDSEHSLEEYAATFINEEKKVNSVEEAIAGAQDIIAEMVADDPDYRRYARFLIESFGKIVTKENVRDEKGIFDMYKDYQEPISKIASHRILAINRGEAQKALKVSTIVAFDMQESSYKALKFVEKLIELGNKYLYSDLISAAILLAACNEMASLNVKANASMLDNQEEKEKYLSESLDMVNKSKRLKNKIINTINKV